MESKALKPKQFPRLLKEIPSPPKELYLVGDLPPEEFFYLAVVGTRRFSNYGKEACERIIGGLAGHNFVIVSGLAIGIDSIAHRAALQNKLLTIAVPGSGLNDSVLHPPSNRRLAKEIVEAGGCLVSEFPPKMPAGLHTFPQRNRIIAGLCSGVLIIEAPEKSGALITARFALDFNRDVFAVPGSIFSENSIGTNRLIKMGAIPVVSADDVLEAYGIEVESKNLQFNFSLLEEKVLSALNEPMQKDDLIRKLGMPASEVNSIITMLQINGVLKESGGEIYRL
ncbi:MAG: DNA-processing protein DprA [Candidatus Parcubacteria bacterium]|nr:DNA-processing protein DprA [Candidatus Parcubacteria bacterium]